MMLPADARRRVTRVARCDEGQYFRRDKASTTNAQGNVFVPHTANDLCYQV